MKHLLRHLLLCLLCTGLIADGFAQSHRIRIHIRNLKDTILYLGNYYGSKTYITDSTRIDHQGVAVFAGADLLPPGIYFVLMPDRQHFFEMLMPPHNQQFEITADTAYLNQVVFTHSPDNEAFVAYNQFLSHIQQQLEEKRKTIHDSLQLQQLQEDVLKKIKDYRLQWIHNHPESMLATLFRGMMDPEPSPEEQRQGEKIDSLFAYHYLKAHYWDQLSLTDSMWLRTPILEGRLNRYFSQLVPPQPDSINAAADALLEKARTNFPMYKFILWWLTYTFENSPYMGMDAVFVHLVEKYFMPPARTDWLSESIRQKLIQRAYQLSPNLIGETAPNLLLRDTLQHIYQLDTIRAPYLLLVFWDPTCGHCIRQVPRLDSAWRADWQQMGVKMIGILADGTPQQWKDFMHQHHLTGWLHLYDPDNSSHFRQLYDVYETPVTYLLDAQKRIIAKKLDVEGLSAFLHHLRETASASTP
ncbi:DUF5106 domain-containing protein [Thermoflavifilum thermophilum]|uniref:Peroxiredoxin n=1 Tax=Thermoflavifilum thermophilum TaxID=1393122 RepID=A0A1I7N7J6_9BACT|nr:DUF5106 domain-containing protein [Thermoflavifilum thermophilum]SFV30621.1 Peroxiredoxin [Thermoflavifilum thermophilum]